MRLTALFCLIFLLLPGAPAHAVKRVALVIGNSDYKVAPLRNPTNDATDIAGKLHKLGFDVTLLKNANQRSMEKQIGKFRRKLSQADIRLFYYAGHGMQVQGINYLIPINIEVEFEDDIKYEAVDAGRVLDSMAAAGKGANIVILDACRNNPFKRSFRSSSRGLARMPELNGSIIVYATSPGDVAADGYGRNGLFTEHFLKYLDKPGLTLDQVFKKTGRDVARATDDAQRPWLSSGLYDDIYLAGATMVADGSTYAPPSTQAPSRGSVRVETEPEGAQFFLNGNRAGRTPKTIHGLPAGRMTVSAALDGFESQERIISIQPGETVHVGFALTEAKPATGRLYVFPTPKDASVHVLNISPAYKRGMTLEPGKYHVEVSKSGYTSMRKWVDLGPGQDLDIELSLKRKRQSGKILLGVSGPHTGDLTSYGLPTLNAVNLAAARVNRNGGINGRQVEVVAVDDKCRPQNATNAATHMAKKGVKVVVGHICSGATKAALPIYNSSNTIAISPSATNPQLTQSGDYPNFFRTLAPDDAQAALAVDTARTLGHSKIALIHDNGDYGKGFADYCKVFINTTSGINVAIKEEIASGQLDFSAVVKRIMRSGADCILYGGYHTEAAPLVKEGRRQGLRIPFIGGDGIKDENFLHAAGNDLRNIYAIAPQDYSDIPLFKEVTAEFRRAAGTEHGPFYAQGYAAAMVLMQAMRIADSDDAQVIARTLKSNRFDTPIGRITFDSKGDVQGAGFTVYKVRNGSFVKVD